MRITGSPYQDKLRAHIDHRAASRRVVIAVRRCRSAALCGVLLLAGVALAQGRSDEDTIQQFLRGDRHISYEQFVESIAAKTMRELDTDKDGTLSRAEAEAAEDGSEDGVKVIAFVESKADRNGQLSMEALKRAIAESAQVRTLYENLEQVVSASAPVRSELSPVQVVPQVRIRF